MNRTWLLSRRVLALSALLMGTGVIHAQAQLADGQPPRVLEVTQEFGAQTPIEDQSGVLKFAGRIVELNGFSGFAGQAVDSAYLVTLSGQASVNGVRARPGEVLILPAYSGAESAHRFDAQRFLATLETDLSDPYPDLLLSLEQLSKRQARAIFFGRYEPTRLNLSAPGSAGNEQTRRSVVSDPAIQAIRFSGAADQSAIERSIVETLETALVAGDVKTVAALLDPGPFGVGDIAGPANEARRLLAANLIAGHDWKTLLEASRFERSPDAETWILASNSGELRLTLMPFGDFIYVKSINRGV